MARSNLKILFDCMNTAKGGGATVAERLAVAFDAAGWDTTVLATNDFRDILNDHKSIDFQLRPADRGIVKTLLFRRFKLRKLCKDQNIDMVLSFNFHSGAGVPEVTYHINTIPFLDWASRKKFVGVLRAIFQKMYSVRALKKSDYNIFESEFLMSLAAQQRQIKNPSVAYIGSELPTSKTRDIPKQRDIVVTSSGQKYKQNDMAVAIAKQIPNARLIFIGNDTAIFNSLSQDNQDWAKTSDRVTFTGFLNRDALFDRLRTAWCLLSCSELESFYMVAVEAMAVGCPALVADRTSASESIGDAGFLFSDAQDAVAQLAKLEDAATWKTMSKAGINWSQQFEANRCAAAFVEKINKVVNR